MFSIIEHIEYLTMCHDCVVIPGWGAFIANYSVAEYDVTRSVFGRPCRAIGFNSAIKHNDGLLAQSLMRREGLSYDEAMRFIADSVKTFGQQLSMDGELSVGRLGSFSLNSDGRKEFVPFADVYTDNRYYGLADVELKTVTALERDFQESEAAHGAVVPGERGLFSRKAARIAASVAVLLGLGIMLTTPVIVDRNSHAQASMAPTVTAPQSQPLDVTVQQGVVPQSVTVVSEENVTFGGVGNTSGKYYMVIATLRNQSELDAFKTKYPALVPHMKLMDYKGLTCVYVARSDDYAQLMSLRDSLPKELRDIWIYN